MSVFIRKRQNFLRVAPYGRGRPTAGALRARRPTGWSPRSDPTSEARRFGADGVARAAPMADTAEPEPEAHR